MATVAIPTPHGEGWRALPFALAALAVAVLAAVFAGWLPLGFSVVTVFLFAGPHNWLEFRYFLTRLPGRLGKLRYFFGFALLGTVVLTAAFAGLPWLAEQLAWEDGGWFYASALWNTAFTIWVVVLVQMRARQNPRREWFWTIPIAFVLLALTWLDPYLWSLALVYLHPLMALGLLDREIRRSRPELRSTYHLCLLAIPVLLGALWWHLADSPNLPGEDALTVRITHHAGASYLSGVSSHLLVATHTFLEMIHYGVWVVAMPLIGLSSWRLDSVPLARRSLTWKRGLLLFLALGACVTLLLWGCFLADYPTTRDVYFTVALVHVLAEVPFLLRSL